MKRIALFPGSFDPITLGHESIVRRALPLFDEVIIAIGENTQKKCMFPLDRRIKWIEDTFQGTENVRVETYNLLTVDYCKQRNAKYIIRGLRNSIDFQYEQNIALINNELNADIETVFLLTEPRYTSINSSFIREIVNFGGEASRFLPEGIQADFNKYIKEL